jgi:hypothetical protein
MASRRRPHGGLPGSHPEARPFPAGAGDASAGLPLGTAVFTAGPSASGGAPAEISTASDSSAGAAFMACWPDDSSRISREGGSSGSAAGEAGAAGRTVARVGRGIGLAARATSDGAGWGKAGGASSITRMTMGAVSGEAGAVLGGRTQRRTSARQRWARSESAKPSRSPTRFSLVLDSRVVLPSVTRMSTTVLPAFGRVRPLGSEDHERGST